MDPFTLTGLTHLVFVCASGGAQGWLSRLRGEEHPARATSAATDTVNVVRRFIGREFLHRRDLLVLCDHDRISKPSLEDPAGRVHLAGHRDRTFMVGDHHLSSHSDRTPFPKLPRGARMSSAVIIPAMVIRPCRGHQIHRPQVVRAVTSGIAVGAPKPFSQPVIC